MTVVKKVRLHAEYGRTVESNFGDNNKDGTKEQKITLSETIVLTSRHA